MPSTKHSEVEDETAVPLLAIESDSGVDTGKERDSEDQPHLRQALRHARLEHPYEPRINVECVPPKLRRRTPLPLLQLFILFGTRLSEPIAYTQIFPVSHFCHSRTIIGLLIICVFPVY